MAWGMDIWRCSPKSCQVIPMLPGGAVRLRDIVLVALDWRRSTTVMVSTVICDDVGHRPE